MQRRKVTYALYPTFKQNLHLFEILRLHKDLWNGALEERIDKYRKTGKGASYDEQCAALTELRAQAPEYEQINCSAAQVTLRRLNKAFAAFFERVRLGQTPGFPRYKSIARMPSIGFKSHGDGWRFTPGKRWKHGSLYLSGIGSIKARGEARQGGKIKSCEVLAKKGKWFLSLTLECESIVRVREADRIVGVDWGINTLLTSAVHTPTVEPVWEQEDNPRWYRGAEEVLTAARQALSRKKRGSAGWRRAAKKLGKLTSLIARKRHEFQHQLSARIAGEVAIFATESLGVKNMTASAKGSAEEPGSRVEQKAGLNREILDTAPAALFQKIAYKVTETGGWFVEAPTRALKPSQTCPRCKAVKKKALSERTHRCECGFIADRDYASARVVLDWLLEEFLGPGTGPIGCNPETAAKLILLGGR
jgi:putative transposase